MFISARNEKLDNAGKGRYVKFLNIRVNGLYCSEALKKEIGEKS